MTTRTRKIEIHEDAASALERRAAEEGVSVSELIAELVEREPRGLSSDQVAELDRRWAAIEAGETTVPHDRVVEWLRTWGTPAYKPWRE